MMSKRKKSREASGSVVVVLSTAVSHPEQHQRGMMGGVGVRLQARRELLHQMAPQYRAALPAQKRELLEAFAQVTGYHRKYAMWLLNHSEAGQTTKPCVRLPCYGPEVQEALVVVWNAANRICAKNLIPFLPTFVEALERHGHLHLSETCREQLLALSAATADRLLRASRVPGRHGLSTTQAGTLLKQQIPIRTFQQWNDTQPGFLQVDVVAHCETDVKGDYISTLTLTDAHCLTKNLSFPAFYSHFHPFCFSALNEARPLSNHSPLKRNGCAILCLSTTIFREANGVDVSVVATSGPCARWFLKRHVWQQD